MRTDAPYILKNGLSIPYGAHKPGDNYPTDFTSFCNNEPVSNVRPARLVTSKKTRPNTSNVRADRHPSYTTQIYDEYGAGRTRPGGFVIFVRPTLIQQIPPSMNTRLQSAQSASLSPSTPIPNPSFPLCVLSMADDRSSLCFTSNEIDVDAVAPCIALHRSRLHQGSSSGGSSRSNVVGPSHRHGVANIAGPSRPGSSTDGSTACSAQIQVC